MIIIFAIIIIRMAIKFDFKLFIIIIAIAIVKYINNFSPMAGLITLSIIFVKLLQIDCSKRSRQTIFGSVSSVSSNRYLPHYCSSS